MTREAMLYEPLTDRKVHCYLCAHHCVIAPSKFGFCGVRENIEGKLHTYAYGRLVAMNVDPIEKKPLFHVFPGTKSFSVATIGCNFMCGFCQNWEISQAREAEKFGARSYNMRPEDIVEQAKDYGCRSISYTYTEPTIFFEYAYETARKANEEGLANIFVTNGYMTEEALDTIAPYLDAANVDLKSFSEQTYRTVCKATLEPVLGTIRRMHERGIWVEVTTLVVPGTNDSREELGQIAGFIAGVGKEVPWHVSMFHPDYRYAGVDRTPRATLEQASLIGRQAGLRYVYVGNVAEEENTRCSRCNELLIKRFYFNVIENRLNGNRCPRCDTVLEGRLPAAEPHHIKP